jgi:hypothetical protein
MPLPAIWGPRAWELLHAICAKAGNPNPKLAVDERRELLWLIEHIENILPCPECRNHVKRYRRAVGIPGISSEAAKWLWDFHEAVNQRLEKPPGPSFDSMPFTSTLNISQVWREYQTLVKDSIIQGHLNGNALKDFGRHLYLWKSFAGL